MRSFLPRTHGFGNRVYNERMRTLLILALAVPAWSAQLIPWKPGIIETHNYKTAESGVPGTYTYTLRGVMREGKKVLEVEMIVHRTLVLGGQEGRLATESLTWLDPDTFDFIASRLRTTLNDAEASFLRSERVAGGKVQIRQKLRGSPEDTRTVDVASPVVEENALLFYLEHAGLRPGQERKAMRYSAAQGRSTEIKLVLDKDAKDPRILMTSDIAPSVFYLRAGTPPVVVRTEVAGTEQLRIVE